MSLKDRDPAGRSSSFDDFAAAVHLKNDDVRSHGALFRAILFDAFKGNVEFEPLYGHKGILATEALSHPEYTDQDDALKKPSIQDIANSSYSLGLAVKFDILTATNALKKAKALPITINISVESALSKKFWKDMKPRLKRYNPEDIIFEILEHDVKPGTNIGHLEKLKAEGYRFALDDFDLGPIHKNRLSVFGDLVDFIKIDGKLVRNCLDRQEDMNLQTLRNLMDTIKTQCPHVQLIAEHVDTFDKAKMLFAIGLDAVQGKNLRQEDYEATILNRRQKDDIALHL